MNENRFNEIAAAIGTDEDRVREIAAMSLDEAYEYFRANGYSFTKEELSAFAEAVSTASQNGELNEKELENAAGGFGLTAALTWAALSLLGGNIACFWGAHALDNAGRRRYGR